MNEGDIILSVASENRTLLISIKSIDKNRTTVIV